MQEAAKQTIIAEIRRLQAEVKTLRQRRGAVLTGASQASVSSGAGSKSFANWSPAQYDEAIAKDLREIRALKASLGSRPTALFTNVMIRRR